MEARIRLTTNCNLKCEYCFAKEFKNSEVGDFQEKNLNILIKKLLESNIKTLKIQGGEPTKHNEFQKFSKILKQNGFHMHLYTNGLFEDDYINTICSCYESALVNINYFNIQQENKLKKNINDLTSKGFPIMLGKTLTNEKDIAPFIEFCQQYKNCAKIRIDIARPYCYSSDSFILFRKNADSLIKLLMELEMKGFLVELDCCLPSCFFKENEWKYIKKHINGYWSRCSTIIDISPDLSITSCFCGAHFNNLYIENFRTLKEASFFAEYVENKIRFNAVSASTCINCQQRKEHLCQGGCIGHKKTDCKYADLNDLIKFRNILKKSFDELENETDFLPKAVTINKILKEKNPSFLKKYIKQQLLKEHDNPNLYIFYSKLLIQLNIFNLAEELLNAIPNTSQEALIKKNILLKEIKNGKIYD